jgi:hypothetical protein
MATRQWWCRQLTLLINETLRLLALWRQVIAGSSVNGLWAQVVWNPEVNTEGKKQQCRPF